MLRQHLKDIYDRMFDGFYSAFGKKVPVVLHYAPHKERCLDRDPSGESLKSLDVINETFRKMVSENENMSLFDVRKAPHYVADTRQHGIYIEDVVHYNPETNQWVASQVLESFVRMKSSIL